MVVQKALSNPGVTIAALSLIAGAVYYRLSNLESPREREQYLNYKFDNRKWAEEPLVAEFDALNLVEADGIIYTFRRYVLGQLNGEVVVSLNANFGFDEEMWNHEEFMEPYHRVTECDIEFVRSERLNSDTVQLVFRMDTIDADEIAHAVLAFLGFVLKANEAVDGVELGWSHLGRN